MFDLSDSNIRGVFGFQSTEVPNTFNFPDLADFHLLVNSAIEDKDSTVIKEWYMSLLGQRCSLQELTRIFESDVSNILCHGPETNWDM